MLRRIHCLVAAATLIASLGACAPGQGFNQIGSSLLSSTGFVSGSQADSLFAAGDKLARASQSLSDEEQYYLGRGVSAMVLSKYRPYKNSAVNLYVNKVGLALVALSEAPETYNGYRFMVLDSDEVNAISAPGGFVFVTRGLLRLVPDEDALAAVLAHEIGHVTLGHGTKAISQANLTEALLLIGKEAASSYSGAEVGQLVSVFGDSINDVFNTLVTKGYSRSQEYDADEVAVGVLNRAGYNANGLLAMLTALDTVKEGKSGGWYSTHPEPEDRIDEIESEVDTKAATTPEQAKRAQRFKQIVRG